MRFPAIRAVSAGLLLVCLLPIAAQGQFSSLEMRMASQDPPAESIIGVGYVSVKRPPAALRMHVELFGKGKTLEEALKNLKDRRQAARAQLEALKADPKSIVLGSPTLSDPQSEQKSRLEAMVMERYSARGRKPPKALQVPKSFTVSASLKAEWPLQTESPEELLLVVQSLEEKVKAADLTGAKDAQKLSPEEEELAEEMAQMSAFSGDEQVKPGEPYFLYVARISKEDRAKAFAEAFAKAKTQGAEVARAAGARLGPLVGLSGAAAGGASYGDDMSGYERRAYLMRLTGRQSTSAEPQGQNEAVASAPGSLAFAFQIKAVFRLDSQPTR